MSLTTEQKVAAALLTALASYGAFFSKEGIKKNREAVQAMEVQKALQLRQSGDLAAQVVQRVPTTTDRLVDHPLVPWLLENSFPWINAYIKGRFMQMIGQGKSKFGIFIRLVAGNMVGEEMMVAFYGFLAKYVYAHIPWFSDKRKEQTYGEILKDYVTCNLPIMGVSAIIDMALNSSEKVEPVGPFRPMYFLLKLFLCRLFTDLFFWIGHYIIHLRNIYFIHKKHHEHNYVQITTNYHFSAVDLFIEAFFPFLSSLLSMGFLGVKTTKYEEMVLQSYIFSLETASHAGKAIPTMTFFPPFSFFTRYWDDWNPWFHANHHMLLRCNYSITPFWDWVFGTDRW